MLFAWRWRIHLHPIAWCGNASPYHHRALQTEQLNINMCLFLISGKPLSFRANNCEECNYLTVNNRSVDSPNHGLRKRHARSLAEAISFLLRFAWSCGNTNCEKRISGLKFFLYEKFNKRREFFFVCWMTHSLMVAALHVKYSPGPDQSWIIYIFRCYLNHICKVIVRCLVK